MKMKEDIKISYSSAGEVPLKVIMSDNIRNSLSNGGMIPMSHLQLIPTNFCNLNCPFCSCAERDKEQQMTANQIYDIMVDAKNCGCEAVTITGGGEPLLHPNINGIIHDIHMLGIDSGLVTNGTVMSKLTSESLSKITWIRISSGDHRGFSDEYAKTIDDAVKRGRNVDWAFSHVVGAKPNFDTICKLVDFANKHNFTHVRLVSDLLNLENVSGIMEGIKVILKTKGIDDSIVNYQDRQIFTKGRKDCLISLLKPVVGADHKIYSCCGIQYAFPEQHLDLVRPMGDASELKQIYLQQENFDGSQCVKCYYDNYNTLLASMKNKIKHEKFV